LAKDEIQIVVHIVKINMVLADSVRRITAHGRKRHNRVTQSVSDPFSIQNFRYLCVVFTALTWVSTVLRGWRSSRQPPARAKPTSALGGHRFAGDYGAFRTIDAPGVGLYTPIFRIKNRGHVVKSLLGRREISRLSPEQPHVRPDHTSERFLSRPLPRTSRIRGRIAGASF
jgi:hypothetical protein